MSFTNNKNDALKRAVQEGDVNMVRHTLDQGADPNYIVERDRTILRLAIEKKSMEIFKLLVQYGAKDENRRLLYYIFDTANIHHTKELVAHFIKYNKSADLEQILNWLLLVGHHDGPPGLEILKFLLDSGMPVDDLKILTTDDDAYTPLHVSVADNRLDFVSLLLKLGADIHKKTRHGYSCIWMSLDGCLQESMMRFLIDKGLEINEKFPHSKGKTALHNACEDERYHGHIPLLIKFGADPNILDDNGDTPLTCAYEFLENQEVLVEELAFMHFEGLPICSINLNYIKNSRYLREMFKACSEELQKMKNYKFFETISLADFIMRKNRKKFTFLSRNQKFVDAFISGWNREQFPHYTKKLHEIFGDNIERRDISLKNEKKLKSILKNRLPYLVIRELAYNII